MTCKNGALQNCSDHPLHLGDKARSSSRTREGVLVLSTALLSCYYPHSDPSWCSGLQPASALLVGRSGSQNTPYLVHWRSCCSRRMIRQCYQKCIVPRPKHADLELGEMTCIDRCVPKYFEVHDMVQEAFQSMRVTPILAPETEQ